MKEFDRLVSIMERLRAPGGCPWDAEQDHDSIARCTIEEAYELVDAIDSGDIEHLREELGDVLLQVVFHSNIAKDNDNFTIADVINDLCDKLISRHPHVFGEETVENSDQVLVNWERLKKRERGKQERKSMLDGIPEDLPSLLYARKIQSAASKVGFDWKEPGGILDKIREESFEVSQAIFEGAPDEVESEIGDLLFSVVNLSRYYKIDPETALRRSNKKFKARFYEIEKEARARGMDLMQMSLEDMDEIWEKVKSDQKGGR